MIENKFWRCQLGSLSEIERSIGERKLRSTLLVIRTIVNHSEANQDILPVRKCPGQASFTKFQRTMYDVRKLMNFLKDYG